jgi:hypothetical protein
MTAISTPANERGRPTSDVRSGRVVIIGDDAADLASSADRLRTSGFSAALIGTPASLAELDRSGAADADVAVGSRPLAVDELVDLLESGRGRFGPARVWTIVQTRHLSSAERRRLIKAGADFLLAMPGDDSIIGRMLHAALMAAATSDAIQEYIASHKSAVGRMISAVFEIQTMDEAEKLTTMLATNYPSPERAAVGIWELLSNAIEHGNLEIDYNEKTALLEGGRLVEEITRRLRLPRYADRVARVEFKRTGKAIHLRVSDQGPGFDFEAFQTASIALDRPNGRGISIARNLCFERVTYRGRGNVVEAALEIGSDGDLATPCRSE